jgi:hypothetical protein
MSVFLVGRLLRFDKVVDRATYGTQRKRPPRGGRPGRKQWLREGVCVSCCRENTRRRTHALASAALDECCGAAEGKKEKAGRAGRRARRQEGRCRVKSPRESFSIAYPGPPLLSANLPFSVPSPAHILSSPATRPLPADAASGRSSASAPHRARPPHHMYLRDPPRPTATIIVSSVGSTLSPADVDGDSRLQSVFKSRRRRSCQPPCILT